MARPESTRARTRRALSQNLLTDPAAVRRMITAAHPTPGSLVVEPGAGRGALTAVLAERHRVLAYEIDPRSAAALRTRFAGHERVRVAGRDFLTTAPPRERFVVVGNIPYGSTGAIVRWCLRAPAMGSATLLTQWEHAAKRTGGYGRWTRLTVATWPEFDWRRHGRVDRRCFRPAPRVDGGILRIERRARPLLRGAELGAYREMVDLAFTGLGGGVRASLARRYGRRRAADALRAAGVPADALVGFVTPRQWIEVSGELHRGVTK